MADGHNGLAEVALAKGDMVAAEKHYLTEYEKDKASLGTEAKKAFSWLFDDLLARHPNDNQGIRYLVAPAHLLKDDLPGALGAFDWFERHYAEDIPDPRL